MLSFTIHRCPQILRIVILAYLNMEISKSELLLEEINLIIGIQILMELLIHFELQFNGGKHQQFTVRTKLKRWLKLQMTNGSAKKVKRSCQRWKIMVMGMMISNVQ